jgi:DNA polymerase III psi subunit
MELNKHELMLGNYFYLPNGSVGKISYHEIRLMTVSLDKPNYKSIPLTEDWLLKFGFASHFSSDPQDYPASKVFSINVNDMWFKIHMLKENDKIFSFFTYEGEIIVKTVHQLQNIFKSLTLKNLTAKHEAK